MPTNRESPVMRGIGRHRTSAVVIAALVISLTVPTVGARQNEPASAADATPENGSTGETPAVELEPPATVPTAALTEVPTEPAADESSDVTVPTDATRESPPPDTNPTEETNTPPTAVATEPVVEGPSDETPAPLAPELAEQSPAATPGESERGASGDLPITLALMPGSTVVVGSAVSVKAVWPETVPVPAGTVRYYLIRGPSGTDGACPALDESRYVSAGESPAEPSGAAASRDVTVLAAGDYRWVAAYVSSDGLAATTVCAPLSVTRATPRLTLALSADTAVAGETIQATATLDDGFNPTSGLTYTVFAGDACAGSVHAQSSADTGGNGPQPPSQPLVLDQPGVYAWQATYAGDANNAAASSACVTLTVTVPPTLSLTITQGSEVSFGAISPVASQPGTASQAGNASTYVMTDAVTIAVTGSTGPWVVTCSVAGVPNGMELSWQLAGSSDWTAFSGDPCYVAPDGGDLELTLNYRLRVDQATSPGPFEFDVIYEVSPL